MNHMFSVIKNSVAAIVIALAVTSCDDRLDIIPAGQSTLDKTTDLEGLVNQLYTLGSLDDLGYITGDQAVKNIANQLTKTNTLTYAQLTGDESVDRKALTENSSRYKIMYDYIYKFNIVEAKAYGSNGDDNLKRQLVAEARILRAYFHFLLVNIFAGQYDEATAYKTGGISYNDNINTLEEKTKLNLDKVYEKVLGDCTDEVIADLKQQPTGLVYRFAADFGYAVRARALFQMKRYDEALSYANKALAINNNIEDRSYLAETGKLNLGYDSPNNYMFLSSVAPIIAMGDLVNKIITPDIAALMDDNDYMLKYARQNASTPAWDPVRGKSQAFDGAYTFRPMGYMINSWGLRAESMIYVAAESLIRLGRIRDGLEMIDNVRKLRIENASMFADRASSLDEEGAMALLMDAKRVEFIGTFETFFDMKRWNSEDKYRRDIIHNYGELGTFSITPESELWIFPFPASATSINKSLTHNY